MTDCMNRRSFIETVGATAAVGLAVQGAVANPSPLKVVGLSCSPRKGKTTAAAVQLCLDEVLKTSDRFEVELIDLADYRIPAQLAAGVALYEGEKDDFPSLVPKLEAPEVAGIIIGSPVYFGNMSALCKAFLDRCIAFRKNDFSLKNKVVGALAVGGSRNGGQELTLQSIQVALMSHQVILVGDGTPTAHWGGTLWNQEGDDILKDEFGVSTAKNLGRRVAEVALKLNGA